MRLLLFCVLIFVAACSYRSSPTSAVFSDSQRLLLIQTHLLLGQWPLAKGQLEQIRESARGIEYWRLLSLYWLSIDHIEQALLIHKEALIEFPDDDFLLNNYGVLLGQKEHWKEACESFKKAYQNGVSKRQSVSVNLSRCAIRQNDVNLAKIYLKQAKEIDDLPLIGLMTELNLVTLY